MTLRYMTGESLRDEDIRNCCRCDSYRGYVCAEHREPSYDHLKAQLAAAEAAMRIAAGLISTMPEWSSKHPQEAYEWLHTEAERAKKEVGDEC